MDLSEVSDTISDEFLLNKLEILLSYELFEYVQQLFTGENSVCESEYDCK